MRLRVTHLFLAIAAMTFIVIWGAIAGQEEVPPIIKMSGESTLAIPSSIPSSDWLARETLTGDWGGGRTWLKENGITLKPRLTQFYQGLTAGDGDHGFEYGGKTDLLLNADLGKLGFWNGFSMTFHAEYNFGQSVNGGGGTIAPANTALYFPGMEGADRFEFSSFYFGQKFGHTVSLVAGKVNMIDIAANRPFAGGAGIDSFWNIVFVAPPSGTVPPYLLGALLSVQTEPVIFGLWIYDPDDYVNRSVFDDAFNNGVTFRGSVEFPVSVAGRSGHQGLVATYSTQEGTERETNLGLILPEWPKIISTKDTRYYFAWTFDQYLYQSKQKPKEGFGLFGQFGISDGNPNRLYWSGHIGLGGTGLVPGRNLDNWGIGYYYAAPSTDLKDAFAPAERIRNEQGWEIFYNFALTPWFVLGADLQIIRPSLENDTAIFVGFRNVIRF